jgi:tripartite-type tricarboxylate transporter receptor subunit TctC
MAARPWGRVSLAAAVVIAGISSALGQSVEQFYRDQQLRMIVGFGPGGGYDAYTRVLARYIGRHIPGNPRVIVQNMPGAASLKSVQYLDTGAPRDGTVIAAFNSGLLTESVINPERIQLKFSDVAWLGSISRDLRVCYAWGETGMANFAGLKNRTRFNTGAAALGTASAMNMAVLKNMLGIAVHFVAGYRGSGEVRIAIERRELDGDCGTWASLPPNWISGRKVNPLVRFASVPVPGIAADVPFVGDLLANQADRTVLDVLLAPDAVGRPYVVSRQIPADRLAALRAAFDITMRDKEFLAEAEKLELPVIPMSGTEAEAIVAGIYDLPPALVARARAIITK